MKSALEEAVQALRVLQNYVGVLERPPLVGAPPHSGSSSVAATSATPVSLVGGLVAAERPAPTVVVAPLAAIPGPVVAPREVFPPGTWEAGPGAKASLSPVQQAHLDAALAQAFSADRSPVLSGEPLVAGGTRPMQPATAAIEREAPFVLADSVGAGSPFANGNGERPKPELPATPQPMPAPPSLIAAAPPLPPHFSPFSAPTAVVEARSTQSQPLPPAPLPPQPAPPQPAPPPAVAEASFSPLSAPAAAPPPAGAAPIFVPPAEPAPALGQSAQPTAFPTPPGLPVAAQSESVPSASSNLPFSPFQGLEPAPPPPHREVPPQSSNPVPPPTWPTSPFFGSTQASTAPFRVVEPPPVIHFSTAEVAAALPPLPTIPDAPATPPAAQAPPPPSPAAPPTPPAPPAPPAPAIPEQGQVFNFAELLRANGQR
ncbi:MAG: hypothetical protein ACKV19_21405 [Verrucomicrobiales bacterium]